MKKSILLIACTMVMTIFLTSCEPKTPTSYPDNLIGFWIGATGNMDKWYGLDVLDTQNATLITYYAQGETDGQDMSITYDANTGKGRLIGDGKTYTIKGTTDSTFTIVMVEGTVVFSRSTRPKDTFSLTGYWKEETTSGSATHLLFYPKNDKDSVIVTIITEMGGVPEGIMAHVAKYNQSTYTGAIAFAGGTGKEYTFQGKNFNHMTFDFGGEKALTKQPRVSNAPANIQGTWFTSITGLLEMTIVVDEKNQCKITYNKFGSSAPGSAEGVVHYCQHAGMGVMVPTEYDLSDEYAELFEGFECGIFTIESATQISVSMASLGLEDELIFSKK